jgi:hypothetical protein
VIDLKNIEGLVDRLRIGRSSGERGWRCLGEEQLAAYIEQQVSGREKERIEKHLGACGFCRDQVGFLVRLQEEDAQEPVPAHWLARARALGSAGSTTRPVLAWRWGAAAAATACVALAVTLWLKPQPEIKLALPKAPQVTSPQVMSQNITKPLQSVVPSAVVRNKVRAVSVPEIIFPKANSKVPKESLEFRWKEVKGALSYQARLVTSEGDVLWEERVEAQSAKLPSSVVLHKGETYFLWIRAYLPEGRVVQSKATRFTVAGDN